MYLIVEMFLIAKLPQASKIQAEIKHSIFTENALSVNTLINFFYFISFRRSYNEIFSN